MNRWTINNKYYTADVSVWMAHLHDEFSVENLPAFQQMTALVMVFDMNDVSSFTFLSLNLFSFCCLFFYPEGFIFALMVTV